MNGWKRYQQDATLQLPALDSQSDNHPIRSHRKPHDYSVVRGLSVMALTAAAVATLSTSVVVGGSPTPQSPPKAPSVDLSLPIGPPTMQDDATLRQAERASRYRETQGETKPEPTAIPSSRTERVISYALAQLGKPYRWAQAGPNSFDCSGLLVAAFRTIGVSLYHYTGEIVKRGVRVDRSKLQRGDVVFPAPGHVGIYLGDGQMVHASSGKGRVVIAKVYTFYAARRI